MVHNPEFGAALRAMRLSRGLSQQSFDAVTTREHISRLERGLSYPNLRLVCDLAAVLDVHPLSLVTLAFIDHNGGQKPGDIWLQIQSELEAFRFHTSEQ